MTCEDRRELMLPYLAECLDSAEEAALRTHLQAGCPQCSQALADAQATLDQLSMAIESATPPRGSRERLLQRIDGAERTPGPAPARSIKSPNADHALEPRRRLWGWTQFVLPAGLAAAVAVLVTWAAMTPAAATQERLLGATRAKLNALERIIDEHNTETEQLAARVDSFDTLDRLYHSPTMRIVRLSGGESNPDAWGRVAFDPERNLCHVVTGRLQPVEQNRMYSFWFGMEDQTRLPIGPISVDDSGGASFWVEMPPQSDRIVSAGVSCDPIGESEVGKPSGLTLFGSLR